MARRTYYLSPSASHEKADWMESGEGDLRNRSGLSGEIPAQFPSATSKTSTAQDT
jgi:hypothetical protein